MSTFKNVSGLRLDIPMYDLHVDAGDTFTVPDDQDEFFAGQPAFASSKSQNPSVTVAPETPVLPTVQTAAPETEPPTAVSA